MAEFENLETVEHDGESGMIVSVIESNTTWVPEQGENAEEFDIEASEENPVYLVAFEDRTVPLEEDQLEEGTWEAVEDADEDQVLDEAPEAELADIYYEVDNPADYEEFQNKKAELINVPGADDPEVGFSSDPKGWDRTSYLKAWRTFRGKWRVCYPRMIRHFGPRMAKRWCSA